MQCCFHSEIYQEDEKKHLILVIYIFMMYLYIFYIFLYLKYYINFNTFFYSYNFDIFIYSYRIYIIFRIILYFNYFFVSYHIRIWCQVYLIILTKTKIQNGNGLKQTPMTKEFYGWVSNLIKLLFFGTFKLVVYFYSFLKRSICIIWFVRNLPKISFTSRYSQIRLMDPININ